MVTPPGFFGLQVGAPLDITLPMMLVEQGLQSKQSWWLSVIGRLAPDATVEQARADLEALWDAYLTEVGMPRDKRGYFSGIALVPAARGANELRRTYSEPLMIVMAIVGVVLLGYLYFRLAGEAYALVAIGLISFAAVAQFAPVTLGGI